MLGLDVSWGPLCSVTMRRFFRNCLSSSEDDDERPFLPPPSTTRGRIVEGGHAESSHAEQSPVELTQKRPLTKKELQHIDWIELLRHYRERLNTLHCMAQNFVTQFTSRLRAKVEEHDSCEPMMRPVKLLEIKTLQSGLHHFQRALSSTASSVAAADVCIAQAEMSVEIEEIAQLSSTFTKRSEVNRDREHGTVMDKLSEVVDAVKENYTRTAEQLQWTSETAETAGPIVDDDDFDMGSLRAELGMPAPVAPPQPAQPQQVQVQAQRTPVRRQPHNSRQQQQQQQQEERHFKSIVALLEDDTQSPPLPVLEPPPTLTRRRTRR